MPYGYNSWWLKYLKDELKQIKQLTRKERKYIIDPSCIFMPPAIL